MLNLELKTKINSYCIDFINKKVALLNAEIYSIQNSVQNETKSSAGDKHETARAHLHLELEKLGSQLNEAQKQQNTLQKINLNLNQNTVQNGSLIETDKGVFYIAASIGKQTIETAEIIIISIESPLAKAFLGAAHNSKISFNKVEYKILNFC